MVNCSDDDSPVIEEAIGIVEEIVEETITDSTTSTELFKGDFVSAAHPTSGMVAVSDDKLSLTFTNFKTDNGPKLLVYLSTDTNATEFVNLGDLKGIEGDYSYTIPNGTDIEKFNIVNIWCVDFLVSFGHAELKN